MPEVKLGLDTILLALAVFLLIANMVSTLNKGRKDLRELTGADRRSQELTDIKGRIATCESDITDIKSRLDDGERNFGKISKDTEQIMNVLDGMLMHFISGNDREKLRSVKEELDHYKNAR